jgi:hypothetical protein
MPVGAAIGSAVVGAGATVYASNKAAKASKNALNAQQGQLDKVWGSVNPFLQSGNDALAKLNNPNASFMASPEFGNWWNRQSGLATMGLDANRIGAGLAGTAVNAIGTNGANQGNAALATGNAIGGFAGSIGDLINQYGGGNSQGSSYAPESQTTMPIPEEMKGLY